MTHTDRRGFLQVSAVTAATVALNPRTALGGGPPPAPSSERVIAHPVPLSKVRITGGPLKRAQEADMKYLVELEPDRMMAFYRTRAGLTRTTSTPKGACTRSGVSGRIFSRPMAMLRMSIESETS